MAFQNNDVVISEERFEHIYERHVWMDLHPGASKFKKNFHLQSSLALLTKKTWYSWEDYEIVEEGFKECHGRYFVYVFKMPKVSGFDPWGFPSQEICIYYSLRPSSDARFHRITAYPYSALFQYFLDVRRGRYLS